MYRGKGLDTIPLRLRHAGKGVYRRVLLINLKVCLAVRHLILLTLYVLGRRIRCHSFAIEARKGVDRHVSLIKLQVCLVIGFDFVPGA